jgi:PAS domain S-box-containing protein
MCNPSTADPARDPSLSTTRIPPVEDDPHLAASWLAAVLASANDAIIGAQLDGTVTSWNPSAEKLYGWTAAEMIGQPITRIIPPERQGEHAEIMERAGRGEVLPALETVRRRKDGTEATVLLQLSPVHGPKGRIVGVATITHDVTQTRQLEEQFRQAQKMEAIGRLAGGVAHDFNNLLTIINGYSQILLATLPEHDKAVEMVREINRAGDRAAALTRQLLAYSRKQILQPCDLDLNDLVRNLHRMLGRLIGEDVELVLAPAARPYRVKADPTQLEQVLMNLAVNARDAMPQGGKLIIETRQVVLDGGCTEEYAEIRPGAYVQLSVTDTGIGMDQRTQARIFEPFFTTKDQGQGTGLGLATVYGIVKQSGGHIRVSSEPGQGTTFKVYLPLLPDQAEKAPALPETADLPSGRETVLLVEDEDSVRELARLLLQRAGYTVLEAANGEEALAVSRRYGRSIDLLVTDVIMPKMGGRQLAEALASSYPRMRTLFLSGYTDDAVLRHGILRHDMPFLQKPFSVSSLAHKIRTVLDGK